jgi:hypothetical protein
MLKVVIAEDDLMIADMAEELLVAQGYEVRGIARGVAKAVGRRDKPDLAIIDLDPHSLAFEIWLATLTPEKELVARMAMRDMFDSCRVDLDWALRFDGLIRQLNPGPAKLEKLSDEAGSLVRRLQREMAES